MIREVRRVSRLRVVQVQVSWTISGESKNGRDGVEVRNLKHAHPPENV